MLAPGAAIADEAIKSAKRAPQTDFTTTDPVVVRVSIDGGGIVASSRHRNSERGVLDQQAAGGVASLGIVPGNVSVDALLEGVCVLLGASDADIAGCEGADGSSGDRADDSEESEDGGGELHCVETRGRIEEMLSCWR